MKLTRGTRRGKKNMQKGRKKTMTDENITIVLNALADKIRMQEWEIKRLMEQNDRLTRARYEAVKMEKEE